VDHTGTLVDASGAVHASITQWEAGSVRTRNFGNVSVVINAHAATSHVVNLWPSVCASGPCGQSTVRILEMGSVWPTMPVDITSVSDDDGGDEELKERARKQVR
jgi:hypothetical protein